MGRTVEVACGNCGHRQMYVVESTENDEAVAAVDDASTPAALRLRRLESLPTSLPVGGIITPV